MVENVVENVVIENTTLENTATETPNEQRIDELKQKAKAAIMRKKQEKLTETLDLGDLQLIETSSELKSEAVIETAQPKGKRRSQQPKAVEESVESVVLQQVETASPDHE